MYLDKFPISSPLWRPPPPGDFHHGVDFACPVGTPLPALVSGTIAFEGYIPAAAPGYPDEIICILQADGFFIVYGHLSRTIVDAGQKVTQGEIIGSSGQTGYALGAHLHIEQRQGTKDPSKGLSHYPSQDITPLLQAYGKLPQKEGKSRLAIWKGSPNYSAPIGRKTHIVIHWFGKGTLESTNTTFQRASGDDRTSAHYGISNETVYQWVDEYDVAWHAKEANSYAIGIEHDAVVGRPATDATYETSAKLVAEIAARHHIPLDRAHIIAHRQVVVTQCPGTMDLDRIITRAKYYQGDTSMTEEQFNVRALEIYQQVREDAGATYPGGARQFAIDRVLGGDTFQTIIKADISHYLAKEKLANELLAKDTPAPLTPEEEKNMNTGKAFRTLLKEAA